MAEADQKQPIIIKKVKKGGHGHHGGAWKVAYADFVTAMMAFFLLLWLLNSVTQEQLLGISNYFAPTTVSQSNSGAGGLLAGKTITQEGASTSQQSPPSIVLDLPKPQIGTAGTKPKDRDEQSDSGKPTEEELAEAQAEREEAQFREAQASLRSAIEAVPALQKLGKSLLIDDTPEGLRIQIVDQEGLAMFPRGGSEMYLHTRRIMELVAEVVGKMPQKLAISGHTDATKFVTDQGYSNWELSTDRANAARRELLGLGVPEERVSRVVGKAATDPLMPDDPTNPRNRRLSIILLRGTGEDGAPAPNGAPQPAPARPATSAPAGIRIEPANPGGIRK